MPMDWQDVEPTDEAVFSSDRVTIGCFRATPSARRFAEAGEVTRPIFVFPRTGVYIHRGREAARLVGAASVTFYNSGEPYRRSAFDPRGDACEWFSIRRDILIREMEARGLVPTPGGGFPFQLGPSDPGAYILQRLVVRYVLAASRPDPDFVDECVLEVLRAVLDARCRLVLAGVDSTTTSEITTNVEKFILRCPECSTSLNEIAEQVGVTTFHMCRIFKKETGKSIHQFRQQLRLAHSLHLIEGERGGDLSRVAFAVGFSSHSHFTATFRRTFGFTPSEFRRAITRDSVVQLRERVS